MHNCIEPGCKVLLTNKRSLKWNWDGLMDRYLGRVVQIDEITQTSEGAFTFTIIQDQEDVNCCNSSGKWLFDSSDIVSVIYSPIQLGDIITTKKSVIYNLSHGDLDKEQEDFKYFIAKYDRNVGNVIGHETIPRLDFIGEVIGYSSPDYYKVKIIKSRYEQHGAITLVSRGDAFKLTFEGSEYIEKMLKMTEVSFNIIKKKEEGKEEMKANIEANIGTIGIGTIIGNLVKESKEIKNIRSIPAIYEYKVYDNKTVVVNFVDGTKTRVTCCDNDVFDLEIGIEKCILKKVCGENFKNQIQAVIRHQERAEKLAKEQVAAQKAEKEAREKKYLKNKERKLKRRIQKEAEFQVALQLKKEEVIKKLKLTDKQKKTLNEEL